MSADRIDVWAGQVDRTISKRKWTISSVSEIYVHEDYLTDKIYNDIAVLKVSINTLEKMRFLLCAKFLNQDPKSDIMTRGPHYCTHLSSFCL
jgi:secreted trypsin-like serine protease